MKTTRDKVIGMFLGTAVGDALGMPVETWTQKRIVETFGVIDRYFEPKGHKYLSHYPAGMWTDDTQSMLWVAEGLIEGNGLDMDAQARCFVKSLEEDVGGWGTSTRDAYERMKQGQTWRTSGLTDKPNCGTGTGVCMKIAPVGAYLLSPHWYETVDRQRDDGRLPGARLLVLDFVSNLAMMTHQTSMAISSGFAQVYAAQVCLSRTPETFDRHLFAHTLWKASELGKQFKHSTQYGDDLTERLKKLEGWRNYSWDRALGEFKGTPYCYDSYPFAMMMFLRLPSVAGLYQIATSGGDTDTNASMAGALVGALHGPGVFPKHLIDGLQRRERVLDVANRFCDKFGIN
jgi:ADP-ribosylglycohydrolase